MTFFLLVLSRRYAPSSAHRSLNPCITFSCCSFSSICALPFFAAPFLSVRTLQPRVNLWKWGGGMLADWLSNNCFIFLKKKTHSPLCFRFLGQLNTKLSLLVKISPQAARAGALQLRQDMVEVGGMLANGLFNNRDRSPIHKASSACSISPTGRPRGCAAAASRCGGSWGHA